MTRTPTSLTSSITLPISLSIEIVQLSFERGFGIAGFVFIVIFDVFVDQTRVQVVSEVQSDFFRDQVECKTSEEHADSGNLQVFIFEK